MLSLKSRPSVKHSATRRVCAVPAVRSRSVNHVTCPAPQLRNVVLRAATDSAPIDPETAQEAIDLGLSFCEQKKWSEAVPVFEKAMNLPGTGLKRFRDRPRFISDSEKITVYYNIACCQSKLGDATAGLTALAGALELGYTDFRQIRTDPDLEALRMDERFQVLLSRYEPKPNIFSKLFG